MGQILNTYDAKFAKMFVIYRKQEIKTNLKDMSYSYRINRICGIS